MTAMNGRVSEPEAMDTEDSNQNIDENNNNLYNDRMEKKRRRKLLKEKQRENLVTSGNLFIVAFMKLLREKKASKEVACHYLDRVLHSIFFFGFINIPSISPDEFIPEEKIDQFRKIAPKAFNEYKTHLPCYTPYSIILEYMTKSQKLEDPDSLLTELLAFNKSLWKLDDEDGNQLIANDFALNASVVTYCYVKDSTDTKVLKTAYGASMSCKGTLQRKLMIAISTLHVWDKAISYAVCSAGKGLPITFPAQVHCHAYKFITQRRDYEEFPPCTKCNKMYNVNFCPKHQAHNKEENWLYGNCAENESLSRLLLSDKTVRQQICIKGDNGEILMNREEIQNKFKEEYEDEMKNTVKNILSPRKFKLSSGEWKFFIPSQSL